MKIKYVKPEIGFHIFTVEDIITASSPTIDIDESSFDGGDRDDGI